MTAKRKKTLVTVAKRCARSFEKKTPYLISDAIREYHLNIEEINFLIRQVVKV